MAVYRINQPNTIILRKPITACSRKEARTLSGCQWRHFKHTRGYAIECLEVSKWKAACKNCETAMIELAESDQYASQGPIKQTPEHGTGRTLLGNLHTIEDQEKWNILN
jgi:hypothetical protein